MKKGGCLPSAQKMSPRGSKEEEKESKTHCDCPICKSACFLAGLKDHTKGFRLVPSYRRDAFVNFTHMGCGTQTGTALHDKACKRGIVVARCSGCDDLIPVADAAGWLGDGTHETIERKLFDYFGENVLPKGLKTSFNATFESPDDSASVKLLKDLGPGACDLILLYEGLEIIPSARWRGVKAQSCTNGGSKPATHSETGGGSSSRAQKSRMNGGNISKAQPGSNGGSNPEAQSGTTGGGNSEEKVKNKKKKNKKKKKSQEMPNQSAGENNNDTGSSSIEFSPDCVLVQNGGGNCNEQSWTDVGDIPKAKPGINEGTNPKTQSCTNGGSDPREEQKNQESKKKKKKKSHEWTDQSAGENKNDSSSSSEVNPEFRLVQEGEIISRGQQELNDGSNSKEPSWTNEGSISKAQPGTSGGRNPKTHSEPNGVNGPSEEKNKKSKKKKKKQSHGRTDQSISNNNTNGSFSSDFNPEFALVHNGGSNHRAQPEMNRGSNPKEQSGTSGLLKGQPGIDGGTNLTAELGTNGVGKPNLEQKNEKSKKKNSKKKKLHETSTDQSAGENKKNNGPSSPAFNPEFVLVQNSIRDATVEFVHPLCDTQSERLVNIEAFHRGVVVVRCGGCNDLVAIADHADWFGEDGEPEKVESFLGFLGVDVPKGSDQSFCATFESKDQPKTNGRVM